MMRYALLYERLNVATRQPETIITYYAEDRTTKRRETIAAPRREVEQTMKAQGWQYESGAGPISILLKREAK